MHHEFEVAASWWVERIKTKSLQNVGDATNTIALTIMQPSSAERNSISQEQLARFSEMLIEAGKIVQLTKGFCVLSVDYHPGRGSPLELACDVAGIDTAFLPKKTTMWVDPGKVTVSWGYGKSIETLYTLREDTREDVRD